MQDISIRRDGRAGRITLQRPQALNALTYPMCRAIADTLVSWQADAQVELVIIDAEGDRAFCAGGDIADMYSSGRAGKFDYGQKFWRDEYQMNAAIAAFPKPVVSFLQGYTMGGGVGVGCHGSNRIVGGSSRIAMPECGIGLVPDVGGSYLLAKGPGRLGECLGITGRRMGPADAIYMGFADNFVLEESWPDLKRALCATGNAGPVAEASTYPPAGALPGLKDLANKLFSAGTLGGIVSALENDTSEFSAECLRQIRKNSPLSMACAVSLIRMQRDTKTLRDALSLEYRFVFRSLEQADFLEGIRARIIDKDNSANWRHGSAAAVKAVEVQRMLDHLGEHELVWDIRPERTEQRGEENHA